MKYPNLDGILIKKQFGQHFLQDQSVLDKIVSSVTLSEETNVFEIGGGSGVLTRTILRHKISRLWVFEIDAEWAEYLSKTIDDPRLTVYRENFLDIDFSIFKEHKKWTILSNLPYNVTFPILHKLVEHRDMLNEGVIMIQEEVAQKILKQGGRDYGFVSLYFQYYFDWKFLDKVPPEAFLPSPKVDSRLLYLRPRESLESIKDADLFWKFIKICFRQPRRTLENNLRQSHYDLGKISKDILALRAQQLVFKDFLDIWDKIN